MIDTTRDALLGGRILYEQPTRGYRVALEAPMLARFAVARATRAFRATVDLGAGPAAVSLCLLSTGWTERAVAVEIDAAHAELARRNAMHNAVDLTVVEGDVADIQGPRGDLVIANPPWFQADAGAVASGASRAGARAFTRGSLGAFIGAARRLLLPRGRVVLSMPAARLVETLATLRGAGLHAKRMRFIHPRASEEADVVFLEAKPGRGGGLAMEPPWNVRGPGEDYTEETYRTLFTAAWGRAGAGGRSSEPAAGSDPA